MWDFIKRWHPLLVVAIALYMAIPKPAPDPAEIDEDFVAEWDANSDGVVDRDEYDDIDFEVRDSNNDGKLTVGSTWRWPLHAYKWNLGQDLQGGSSIRYKLVQQDMDEAETDLREMFNDLQRNIDKLSPEALEKFGPVIDGGAFEKDMFEVRETKEDKDDFDLLYNDDFFDEGRVDAARRFWTQWNRAANRRDANELVEPTIATLNTRLNSSGVTELNIAPLGDDRIEVKLPKFASLAETERYKKLLETTGKLQFRVLAPEDGEFANLQYPNKPRDDGYKYDWIEVAEGSSVSSKLAKTVGDKTYVPVQVIDDYNVGGKDLDEILPGTDPKSGGMTVTFKLKGVAVANFERLTEQHREDGPDPRLLAIVIDGQVYSAYNISEKISGSVQLTGRFSREERDSLINVLKSGSLNVKLILEGEESVGPSEGAEAVSRGLWSLVIGASLVFILAVVLYHGMGFLTIFNLLTVLVLVMGALSAGLGTLTMPGIAGIVLTIGMAIDANILINERIREEMARGLKTRGAVEEGFRNALSSIVDANITTLLTALILFKIGSGPIKGFALTLAIGIVATLYASLLSYRSVMMGVLNVKRDMVFTMASLKWLRNRNINFLAWIKYGLVVSAIFVIGGSSFLFTHGSSVLGMEFRGGHTFRVQLNDPIERDELETLFINEDGTPKFEWAGDMELQPVHGLEAGFGGTESNRFDLRFPMKDEWTGRDQNEVNVELRHHIEDILGDRLAPEGWTAEPFQAKELTFEARMRYRLKNPETFKSDHGDDFTRLWLIHERSWRKDGENAPLANKDKWFGGVTSGNADAKVLVDWEREAGDGAQLYTLTISGLTVRDAADRMAKKKAFEDAIDKWFTFDDDTSNVEMADKPEISEFTTKGSLRVEVTFVRPVNVEDFTSFAESLPRRLDNMQGGSLTVSADGAKGDEARAFTLTTSEQTFSSDRTDAGHFLSVSEAIRDEVLSWVKENPPEDNYISSPFLLASAIGAVVADEAKWQALIAILAALIVVVIYIRLRFASVSWGLAAVVALIHDTTVVLGLIGLVDWLGYDVKIDLTVVAALLTVIGYSLNDTIINFDRIREILRKDRLATGGKLPLKTVINRAVNEMLSRTVLTSSTTLATTLAMLAFGGPLLKGFAFAMTCGVVVGTFSSIYIAGPVLLLFDRRGEGALMDLDEDEQEISKKVETKSKAKEETDSDTKDESDDKSKDEDKAATDSEKESKDDKSDTDSKSNDKADKKD